MSSRTLSRLFAAALGLLAVYFLITLIPRGGDGPSEETDEWSGFFSRLNRVTVDAVRFDSPDGPRVLSRAGDAWLIDGVSADSGTVARFWESVEEAAITELVARNPDNHARMGLAANSAFQMTFELDEETRSLLVGNQGPSSTAFVRRPESDNAYLLNSNLRAYIIRSLSDWRDRRVVVLDTARIARVELSFPADSYAITRGDGAWQLVGGGEVDESAARGLLEELGTLRANGFLEEGDPLLDAPGTTVVTALTEAGDSLATLTLGGEEGDRWVTAEGNDTVYRLPGFRVDRLVPSRERLEGG